VSVGTLFLGFCRIGLFAYGGGPSMIPLMKEECLRYGFVTEEQFLEGLATGNALPGPITTKMALYVGWHDAGVLGALGATIGLLLPSTLLMAGLTGVLVRYRGHPWVAASLEGAKPAIVGMLFFTAWDLAPAGVRDVAAGVVAIAAFAALYFRVHPAFVIVAAMALGVLLSRI
jgi:chromate transporter